MDDSTAINGGRDVNHPAAPGGTTSTAGLKRGKYNSRACLECQRRKVKCVGNGPGQCQQCRISGADCVFRDGPRKKPKRRVSNRAEVVVVAQPENEPVSIVQGSPTSGRDQDHEEAGSPRQPVVADDHTLPLDIINRLIRVEQALARHEKRASSFERRQPTPSSTESPPLSTASNSRSNPFLSGQCHTDQVLRGGTSSHNPIAVLNQLVGHDEVQPNSGDGSFGHCPFVDCNPFPECDNSDIQAWIIRIRSREIDQVWAILKRYFVYLNPHYPCLNEHRFFADFESYIGSGIKSYRTAEGVQFIALVNIVIALMKTLEEYCTESSAVPGWQEFSRANHLLTHTTWLGKGDVRTIQSLIIKALYLLYNEEYNAAYDAIGQTVRLCFQNSLHRQSTWTDCTLFEIHMRQRTFWSIYCLDRTIAQVCGMPYLIRESEFQVDLPASVDDRLLGQSSNLPQEMPGTSPMPYQHGMVKWGKLSAEVWDAIYGMEAKYPISEEFIVTMDARIKLLRENLPPQLKWRSELITTAHESAVPQFVIRQAAILHLRTNHLRLLLRRQEMLTLDFQTRTAEACLSVAIDSIDTIYATHFSPMHQELERYSAITYLTGAIIPIACIILKDSGESDVQECAINAFEKAMVLFKDIAPGLCLARATLKRLRRVISTVEKNSQRRKSGSEAHNSVHLSNPIRTNVDETVAVEEGVVSEQSTFALSQDGHFPLRDLVGGAEMLFLRNWDWQLE